MVRVDYDTADHERLGVSKESVARTKKDIERFSGGKGQHFLSSVGEALKKTYGIVQPLPKDQKWDLERVKKIIDETKV